MSKECASGFAAIQNATSYTLTKAEFSSIFGGGNDTVVQDFFYYEGDIPKIISLPQGFCSTDLGEYEDISNLEILMSLLLVGGVVTTAIALLLPYLKILRNVERFLQESRVCDCKKATATEPQPIPSPSPNPDPNPVPPDTCCTECFQTKADAVKALNDDFFDFLDGLESQNPNLVREPFPPNPPQPPYQWETLACSPVDQTCQFIQYVEQGGTYRDSVTGLTLTVGDVAVQWNTGRKLLYREFCDIEPQPEPTPTPTPTPLPPESFDFCEQFPALCNACPDVGNSQDVVVSGKIAATCLLKNDISFNIKF